MVEIFNVHFGAYWKFRQNWEGEEEGALICRVGALSISREERFLSYLSNRTKFKRIDHT